jgi:hypothetical protein
MPGDKLARGTAVTARDPEIVVADVNLPDADLVLGFDFVSSRRMWFSYGSHRIFLSRPRR